MKTRYRSASAGYRFLPWALASALLAVGAQAAFAADPDHVTFTLEGCNNDGTIALPNGGGDFICPDSAYTTGNLGKNWSELDLVPHRVTLDAGNAAPLSQTYSFVVEADNCNTYEPGIGFTCADGNDGHPGFDVVSYPTLNTALSSDGGAGCTNFSASAQFADTSGAQGVVVSVARTLTLTQARNSTCVYDYYQRVALGAHLFSGSNLHSDLHYSGGQKEVPLPVNQIAPQSLSKDMHAAADQTVSWNLTKEGTPTTVSFGDVCADDAAASKPATITVSWTKNPATAGAVTATANVYATNPSSRTITTTVIDRVYQGSNHDVLLHTSDPVTVNVPAGSAKFLVMTDTVPLPADSGNVGDWLNDEATATYSDADTGIPIPGEVTASASAMIDQGSVANDTADISDSESISGTGLTFSVPSPLIGSFDGYTAGTQTTGPVAWAAADQASSGSITFDKTIYLANQMVGNLGTLSDTAYLDTTAQHLSSPVSIGIDSSATVKLTISKTIPAEYLTDYLNQTGDTLTVRFDVSGAGGYSNSVALTFANGDADVTKSLQLSGLTPDTYTVTEKIGAYCSAQEAAEHKCTEFCDGSANCTTTTFLQPAGNPLAAYLSPQDGSMAGRCTGTVAFTNDLNAQGVRAQVEKVTAPELTNSDPDYAWTFTLAGPNVSTCLPAVAGAGAGPVLFQDSLGGDCLLSDGNYTVTETLKPGWQEDGATPNDGANTMVCAFSVNLITDDGTTFSCSFHNTRYGYANVVKTVAGQPPSGTDAFTFQLRQGTSGSQDGTILETLVADVGNGGLLAFLTDLVPGNHYQLCELVMPGWLSSLPNPFIPPSGSTDGAVCTDFTVNAGETRTIAVDNTPPPGGLARTIGFWKNWASCSRSNGRQEPVLDETLAAAPPPGIKVGSFYLSTGQCAYAVNLLSKSTMSGGANMASDPLFRLAAQLIGAELNVVAGAAACPAATDAITSANALLAKYSFSGNGYSGKLSKADAQLANTLATTLDMYNNNLICF